MDKDLSENGLKFIAGNEGLKLTAYQDSVGVWTVGYGHTGPEVRAGMVVSAQMAYALLKLDVSKCVPEVNRLVTAPISQGQFDALVDFAYNLGVGALKTSTLLRLLNKGDYTGAADEFLKWNHAGGKVLPGLTKRCQARKAMFEAEVVSPVLAAIHTEPVPVPQSAPSFLSTIINAILFIFRGPNDKNDPKA